MYIGSLPVASNRATYTQDFQLYDDEDDEGINLAGAVITLDIRRPGCASSEISATIANGRIIMVDENEGQFELSIETSAMRNLCPMTYECGITVAQNNETTQYFIGTLPVLDGIVR
ncbi:hypothetical protein [Bradyrhizobium sp. LHD-71]|uniref:hypothetical protein n=1 Tax=Bradyrhizobium sp. LHD-71 TaxID=3072141 RepID=UPI00280DF673|nr:hypothetical protein [Bradyrhizobium sp. LHD-71]MDQ8730498.1 hypothetical protein [Bradyrhizobium sp. LHD-71]